MAVAQVSISDVKLTSSWRCYQNSNGSYGSTSPSLKDITLTVQIHGIPAGATVNSASISYHVDSTPNTGADLCTINGAAAGWRPGDHTVALPAQSGGTFQLTFAFRAVGSSHQHVQSHSASLVMRQIVLTVEYTDPYAASDWTINTPSVDAGNPVSVTVSPKGGGYSHHLRLEFGGYAAEASLPAGVNVASIPTQLEWLNAISAAASGTGSITMTTYYGGAAIGQSAKSVTITAPASVVPALEVTVNRNLVVGGVTYPDVTGGYVQQKSAVHAFFNSFAGAYGSHIVSHGINVGGKSDAAFNTDGTSLYSPLLPDAGSIPVTFRVTDSRGRTAQKVITIQVEGYAPPRASGFVVYRTDENGNANDNGTRGRYEFQKTFTSLGGKNSCTATITAAGSEAADVAESGWLVPGAVKELDVLLSYDVYLTLTDAYGSVTVMETIPSINFAMHFSADGTAAWIGEACQHGNAFGVAPGRDVYFYGQELRNLIRQSAAGELQVDNKTALWVFANESNGYGFQAGTPGSGYEFNLCRLNSSDPVVMWVNGNTQGGAIYTEGNPPSPLLYYPVGSIYMSTDITSPAALFGGTWERIPADRFLMATSDGNAGFMGGSFWYNLVANIGAINSNIKAIGYNVAGPSAYQVNHPLSDPNNGLSLVADDATFQHWNHSTIVSEINANSATTQIIPPYYAVYMWRRIS